VERYGFQKRKLVEALLARQSDNIRRRAVSAGMRLGSNLHTGADEQVIWIVADHTRIYGLREVLPDREAAFRRCQRLRGRRIGCRRFVRPDGQKRASVRAVERASNFERLKRELR
jgi:hypothetical protein